MTEARAAVAERLGSEGASISVLHVIPSVSLVHGGPSRAIRHMEDALVAAGCKVETATTDDDGRGKRLAPLQLSETQQPRRWIFRKNTEFYKVALTFVPWILREVKRFDVVHIHALFSFTSAVAAAAARTRGIPYIVRPLGTLADYGMRNRRPWLKRLSLRLVDGPLVTHAAAVHFTSEAERTEAEALGLVMRSVVIPLGIPAPGVTSSGHTVGDVKLLFLSRLDPKKNVESLLQALALLRIEELRPPVAIGGSGSVDYVRSLHALADRLGLSGQVTWLGEVGPAEKRRVWEEAHVFVLPSHSENFGIAAAEALSAGLPCILGAGVAIAKQAGTAGAALVVEPDPAAVADAIKKLITTPQLRARMSAAALELSHREYSTATMGERLLALYRQLAGSKAKRPRA